MDNFTDLGIGTSARIINNIRRGTDWVQNSAGRIMGLASPSGTTISLPYILAQSAIPFVIPSGNGAGIGVIGNNGALSAITALQTTYASCYMYFPVNAIAAGVAAGWYYTVMSTTQAGTIYNNIYTSGTPTIPASPTAFATTGPGNFTQTTASDITSISVTVPGGSMGLSGELRHYLCVTALSNANAKSLNVKLGGTSVSGVTSLASVTGLKLFNETKNRGSQAVQISSNGAGFTSLIPTYSSIDTSVDKALTITLNIGTNTDYIILEGFTIEILPG